MAIFKGSANRKAQGGDGSDCEIFVGPSSRKAKIVRRILCGDENGTARIGYGRHGYTEKDPYLICKPEDFRRMKDEPYACYKLTEDMIIPEDITAFNPNALLNARKFYGTFDGNGKTLQLKSGSGDNCFFYDNYGVIKNVKIETPIDFSSKVFVYTNSGVIKKCYMKYRMLGSAVMVATNYKGGIISECLGYAYKHDRTEMPGGIEMYNRRFSPIANSSAGKIERCVSYLNATGGANWPRLYPISAKLEKAGSVENCWWATMKGADKTGHYGWDPEDKTQWDIREFDSSISPIGQVDLDFENTWYVDENGFLALRGMGPMDFSTN